MSSRNKNKGRLPPFVPLDKATIKTSAWKAMSHGARSLYALLKSYYITSSQNPVYISTRKASAELGSHSHRTSVLSWFHELEWYGFTRLVSPAHHGVKHGKAPHWRSTEVGYAGRAPIRDYLNWDGRVFLKKKRTGQYQAKNKSRGTDVCTRVVQTCVPIPAPNGSANADSGTDVCTISQHDGGTRDSVNECRPALVAQ